MPTTIDEARRLALALPDAGEHDHFGRPSFRVGKRIFATLHVADGRLVVKLQPGDQRMLIDVAPLAYSAAPGWGHHGWTFVDLARVEPAEIAARLETAWRQVAPKRMQASRANRPEKERGAGIEAILAALVEGENSGKPKLFDVVAFKRRMQTRSE